MTTWNFDATDIPPAESDEPLPEGWYHVTIVAAEDHVAKNPDAGLTIKLTVEIDANHHADHKGRQIFDYLCINHKNDKPRNIARKNLSAICHAIDLFPLEEAKNLIGEKLLAKIKTRPAQDGYPASSDIKGYGAAEGDGVKYGSRPSPEATAKVSMKIDGLQPPEPTETSTDNAPKSGAASRAWMK